MKKNIRKILSLSLALVMALSLTISASAASFTPQAEELKELGLFMGGDNGFELDRTPTRLEASIIIVRMLGKEEEALSGTYDIPFTDVPDWGEKYIGYLYSNGLAKGADDTIYGCDDTCTSAMFSTFVLRSLGYSDANGDFSFNTADTFASALGIYVPFSGDMLRDDAVASMYSALFTAPKDGSYPTLLEKLMDDGSISSPGASTLLGKYEAIALYTALSAASDSKPVEVDASVYADVSVLGETLSMNVDMLMKMDPSVFNVSYAATITVSGEEVSAKMYLYNGVMYIDMEDVKMKMDFGFDFASLVELAKAESSLTGVDVLSYERVSYTANPDGSSKFGMTLSAGYINSMLDAIMPMVMEAMGGMGDLSLDVAFGSAVIDTTFKADGLYTMSLAIDMNVAYSESGLALDIPMSMVCTIDVTASGDDVTIDVPSDLDSYTDMSAMLS